VHGLLATLWQRYPDITAPADIVAEHVAQSGVSTRNIDDVVVAWAVGFGSANALRDWEIHLNRAAAQVARRGIGTTEIDEACQQVRIRMVAPATASPGIPAILAYRGRGTLQAFLAISIFRAALPLLPKSSNRVSVNLLVDGADSPELATMRKEYEPLVRCAVLDAWNELSTDARFVLRLELQQGLSFVEMAAILQVHRINAARRVARAKTEWLAATRRLLSLALPANESTVDSVLRLVNLPLSIAELPNTTDPDR
jgi:RNA polymerase sigma-70 factor